MSAFVKRQLEEGALDWARNNKGKIAGGLGALGAAGLGAYTMLHHGEAEPLNGTPPPPPTVDQDAGTMPGNTTTRKINDVYNKFNAKQDDVDQLTSTAHTKNLEKFTKGDTLDKLLNKAAAIREPFQSQDDVILQRDDIDTADRARHIEMMHDTQNNQSKLSDEYAKIKDSTKPVDMIRRDQIVKHLTQNPVILPDEYNQSQASRELTDKILSWDSPEHKHEMQKQLANYNKITSKIDGLFGGNNANKFIDNENYIDKTSQTYQKGLSNDLKRLNTITQQSFDNGKLPSNNAQKLPYDILHRYNSAQPNKLRFPFLKN